LTQVHMRFTRIALLFGLVTGLAAHVYAAPIIVNASFENVVIGYPFVTSNPANVPGWTHTGPVGDGLMWRIGYADGSGSVTVAGAGSQFVTLGGGYGQPSAADAHWTQLVTGFTPGQDYTLSFMLASEANFSGPQSLIVSFPTGSSTGPSPFTGPIPTTNYWNPWVTRTTLLHATATAVTLDFGVPQGTAYDIGLDNIQIGQDTTVVPEPGTLGLLGLGLAAALRRRFTT
jgi:hypothetical protein